MRNIVFFFLGIFAGITLIKSEVASWYRIQEMFRFESFHMYGVIGTAVVIGAISMYLMKRYARNIDGKPVEYTNVLKLNYTRHILAGSIFGLGWALSGACPGPMFAMIGHGYFMFIFIILGATLGTFAYGVVKDKLPH